MSHLSPFPSRFLFVLFLLALTGTPVQSQTLDPGRPSPTLEGDESHPGAPQRWVETRLFFGLGPAAAPHAGVSNVVWRHFLDREVTPRFPAGLSVVEVYGQWLGKPATGQTSRTPERIRSRMLLIAYPPTQQNAAKIEAIRSAWKALTGDQSVLRLTSPVEASF